MFCAGCGSPLPHTSNFCPNCGTAAELQQTPCPTPAPEQQYKPFTRAKFPKKAVIGCLGIAVILFTALLIGAWKQQRDEQERMKDPVYAREKRSKELEWAQERAAMERLDQQRQGQAKPEPPQPKIPYTVAGSYAKTGRNWRMVVVKGPLADSELIALAKDLHKIYSDESIDIFDDAFQIKAYENWAKNYPNHAYPYPEKWVQKHHIGMVNKMLAPGGATWQLLGGTAHLTSPESKIVDLD